MFLVKSNVAAVAPIVFGEPNITWAAGDSHQVDDRLYSRFANDTVSFTVVQASGDSGDQAQAALDIEALDTDGAVSVATVTAAESAGMVHKTVLTLTAVPITLADATQGGGVKIYDMPEGRILFLGAIGSVAMKTTSALASTLNASVACKWGVGTTVQASATLATTEQDVINAASITASATVNVAGAAATGVGVLAVVDGTATPADLYLNVSVPGATDIDADATITVTGTVTITWMNLGDV